MEKEYNREAVEKYIETIRTELDRKVIVELCKTFDIQRPSRFRTIDEVQDAVEFRMGFCHAVWNTQKEVLKRDYDIEWKTPAELNPGDCYD